MRREAYSSALMQMSSPFLLFFIYFNVKFVIKVGQSMYHQNFNSTEKPPAAVRLESESATAHAIRGIRCPMGRRMEIQSAVRAVLISLSSALRVVLIPCAMKAEFFVWLFQIWHRYGDVLVSLLPLCLSTFVGSLHLF